MNPTTTFPFHAYTINNNPARVLAYDSATDVGVISVAHGDIDPVRWNSEGQRLHAGGETYYLNEWNLQDLIDPQAGAWKVWHDADTDPAAVSRGGLDRATAQRAQARGWDAGASTGTGAAQPALEPGLRARSDGDGPAVPGAQRG